MAYEYFISYRRNSGGILEAEKIYNILKSSDIKGDVFWDLQKIGEGTYPPQIENAVREASHFVLLINESFFDGKGFPDDWFFKEIKQALECHGIDSITPIIFCGKDKFSFDDDRMPEMLKELKRCQRIVYSKDNATHFELYVRDHYGLKPKQTFDGYNNLLKNLFFNIVYNQTNIGNGKNVIVNGNNNTFNL